MTIFLTELLVHDAFNACDNNYVTRFTSSTNDEIGWRCNLMTIEVVVVGKRIGGFYLGLLMFNK
jgi:hypothetical protein